MLRVLAKSHVYFVAAWILSQVSSLDMWEATLQSGSVETRVTGHRYKEAATG